MVTVRPTGSRAFYVRVRSGSDLRDARKRRGWTLMDVARFTGASFTYIAQIERGERHTISPAMAQRLAMLYGPEVKFHHLFDLCHDQGGKAA